MSKIIEVTNLCYTYMPGSPYERQALKDISFGLETGETMGIFGPNSSGKSTLAQHLNGLLTPSSGAVRVCNINTADKKMRQELWKKVSLVFQYPEQQIFQTRVFNEVAYGLRNLGISKTETQKRVYHALQQVGLRPELTVNAAPISLSGGARRKVAIASMLALMPEILILDEPMVGLDPSGCKMILDIIRNRKINHDTTVIISHSLKELLAEADKIAILDQGCLAFFGEPQELLRHPDILSKYHLELPEYLQVVYALAERGFEVNTNVSSITEAGQEILRHLVNLRSLQQPD